VHPFTANIFLYLDKALNPGAAKNILLDVLKSINVHKGFTSNKRRRNNS